MNYIRKFKKNSKALSPVVASIILIAVTVAVSVVVAAWMGGMTIGLMGNAEQAAITNAQFTDSTHVVLTIQNTGSSSVTINSATIDGNSTTMTAFSIAKGSTGTLTLSPSVGSFVNTAGYQIKLQTAKGNTISYTATYSP